MWFKEEPSQFSIGQTAQGLTCFIMEKPQTGLDECPRILLSCFRAKNSVCRRHENVKFLVFSDDPDWCRKQSLFAAEDVHIVERDAESGKSAKGHSFIVHLHQEHD